MKIMMNAFIFLAVLISSVCFAADTTTTTTVAVPPVVPTSPVPAVTNPPSTTITTSTTIHSGVSEADGKIVSTIYAKYSKDAAMTGTQITAVSQNGIVTLTGAVTTQSQADEAVLVAKRVIGVRGVISNITVTTNPAGNIPPTIKNY